MFWGKMSEIEDEYKYTTELMDHLTKIYRDHTNLGKKKLDSILKHDIWLNADTSLSYGLVDDIWRK